MHPVERCRRVAQLALAVVEHALGAADAAEIEPQHREAAPGEHVEQAVHDAVVHRAAVKRVRMQDHRERRRRPLAMDISTFQPPVRAVEDHLGHLVLQRTFLALHPVPRPPPPSATSPC